jgi:hypothetical protein
LLKNLKILYRWIQYKLGWKLEWVIHCPRCGGCGEVGCCPETYCDNGFGCAHYYDDVWTEEDYSMGLMVSGAEVRAELDRMDARAEALEVVAAAARVYYKVSGRPIEVLEGLVAPDAFYEAYEALVVALEELDKN